MLPVMQTVRCEPEFLLNERPLLISGFGPLHGCNVSGLCLVAFWRLGALIGVSASLCEYQLTGMWTKSSS